MPLIRYRLSIIPMAGSKYCQINFCYYITNSQATPAPSPASVKQHSRHIIIIMWAIVPSPRHCCWPPWSMQPLCFVNYLKYVQFFSPFGFLRRQAPAGVMREYYCSKKFHPKQIQKFVITEKAPTRAFSWLKAATTAFTFKTLLRHYAKCEIGSATQRSKGTGGLVSIVS